MIELSESELATAAHACRALAFQEGERAKKLKSPMTRGPVEHAAQRLRGWRKDSRLQASERLAG